MADDLPRELRALLHTIRGRAQAMINIAALIEDKASEMADRTRQVALEMTDAVNGLESAVAEAVHKAARL
jgi:hypothetical protein